MPKRLRTAALWLLQKAPLGPLSPYVMSIAIGTPFPHRRPRPLRWTLRACTLLLLAVFTLLALAVLGLALGATWLARQAISDTLAGHYPNRLLRAGQRLGEAGQKLEAAARILLQEGWRL